MFRRAPKAEASHAKQPLELSQGGTYWSALVRQEKEWHSGPCLPLRDMSSTPSRKGKHRYHLTGSHQEPQI